MLVVNPFWEIASVTCISGEEVSLIIVYGSPFLGLCFQHPLALLCGGLPGPGIVSDFFIFLPGFVVTSTCPPRGPVSLAQVSRSSVVGTQVRPSLILTQLWGCFFGTSYSLPASLPGTGSGFFPGKGSLQPTSLQDWAWLPLPGAPQACDISRPHCVSVQFLVLEYVSFGSKCDPVFFYVKKSSSLSAPLGEQRTQG